MEPAPTMTDQVGAVHRWGRWEGVFDTADYDNPVQDVDLRGTLTSPSGATHQGTDSGMVVESNVRYRLTVASEEKQALARAALLQIEPGQAVLIDELTTGLVLARLLPARVPLTVITNSLW